MEGGGGGAEVEGGVSSSPAMEWGRMGDWDREEPEEGGRGGRGQGPGAEEEMSSVRSCSEEWESAVGWGRGLQPTLKSQLCTRSYL